MLGACDSRERNPKLEPFARLSPLGVASAQQTDLVVPPAAISGAIAPVDEAFALFAASTGLAEIEGARLVLKVSKRSEVRDYAQKLMREHEKAMQDLRRIVTPRGLKLPPAPTGRHADMVTKLTGVATNDLDDAFLLRFGVDAHKEAIALYERHAKEGQDTELRRHAQQMLPMLREHMAAAQTLIHAAASAR
jgi:putative membrane protein